MPTRYFAPPHIMSVFINSGEARVEDGFAILPDDATDADHRALLAVGFTLAAPAPEPVKRERADEA